MQRRKPFDAEIAVAAVALIVRRAVLQLGRRKIDMDAVAVT